MKDNENEDYQQFLQESLHERDEIQPYTENAQIEIVKTGKSQARRTNIMISLAILLLIVPVMTLATYLYYSIGSRADKLIDIVTNTIYITEPNMSVRKLDLEEDIGLFSMNITFDVFKRIGKEDYKMGNYDVDFLLDQPSFPKKDLYLDRPLAENPDKESEFIFHPKANPPFSITRGMDILNKLPDGTVAEAYISLYQVMKPKDLQNILPKNIEIRWLAVDTGLEASQEDKEGYPITPIGYPPQYDPTTWSPFKTDDNEKAFMDILTELEKNESVATKVARAKSLSLSSRIAYIKKHGIHIYGAVLTGPTEELRKLQDIKEIRAVKAGEVKLWNWE
ncbi:anti-sigma factor [Neobacillus mesonae]|uniref:anti-sigma factor n=1 Tax=Neobacillus mesonae TaxID=1193713 RepID=UPI00203DA30D|nr:anti-sigma factor [Neobacillus mesonae]MCM3570674.1 anti-sigma factor [Neobacillus mesonae]